MENLIGACGINCSDCSTYKATIANDDSYREATAQRMREQFKIEIRAEDINCQGCMTTGPHIGYCAICKIRICAMQKDIENCAYCDDYPCNDVENFHQKATKAKEYIETLREEL